MTVTVTVSLDSIVVFTDERPFDLNDFVEEHVDFFVSKAFPPGLATQWVMCIDRWGRELAEEQPRVE